jgi:hypothetical protein
LAPKINGSDSDHAPKRVSSAKQIRLIMNLGKDGADQWPGKTITFGELGILAFDSTIDGTSLISTGHSRRMRARKRSSV